MQDTGHTLAPLISEAHRLISEAIAHYGLSVPYHRIVITIQSKGRKSALGWFWGQRWQNGEPELNHEINLCAESLKAHNMGEILIHELAHAENHHLKIKDCSGSQCHNKKFKAMADRLGLIVKDRDKRYGYGYTDLGPNASAFLEKIAFKRELFDSFRVGNTPKAKAGSRMVKICCGSCGYTARTTRQWLETGLPTCPCGEQMEEA